MNEFRHSDLSRIRDEDLTPEQRQEIERRFHAFARALSRVKNPPRAPVKRTVAKWAPQRQRFGG